MRLIVITKEDILPNEGEIINNLFKQGLEVLHIRKPGIDKKEMKRLIEQIDSRYYQQIVLHDYFQLATEFQLKGIHLNRRNPEKPPDWHGSVSCSCHSEDELRTNKSCDYVFLSPIFDSISKRGYKHAYTEDQLIRMKQNGDIDTRVIALGGITTATIPQAAWYGFGGVAVLGSLWNDTGIGYHPENLQKRFHQLQHICKHL